MDDVLLAKGAIIERCWRRVDEEYQNNPARLHIFTYQDAIVLNIQRACQAAIDMAMHIVARERLGAPSSSAEAFDMLHRAGYISPELARRMRGMVGFRNIVVHEYQAMDLDILQYVIEHGRNDFIEFCAAFGISIQ